MTQGVVLKDKLGDAPQLEVIYKKEELSLKDGLCSSISQPSQ